MRHYGLGDDAIPAGTISETPGTLSYSTFFAPIAAGGSRWYGPTASPEAQRAVTTREIWTEHTESGSFKNAGIGAAGLVAGGLLAYLVWG